MSSFEHQLRAVVFDMDGVLIDSHPAHRASWREFLQSLGKNVSEEDLSFILDGHTREEILRHFLGELSQAELLRYGKWKDELFRSMEHCIQPVPGAIEFVNSLNRLGIACAIATSASEIRTFATIERMGLSDSFIAVVTSADVSAGKPDPMVYRLACERLSLPPEHGLAFDDAPSGIQSARSAGMRCVGVSSNGLRQELMHAGAEQVIPNFIGLAFNDFAQAA